MGNSDAPALPERAAIAIVGGGLAAWAVAEALGSAARDAVLVAAQAPAHPNDPSFGIAAAGPMLPFARLIAGHGEALAAAGAAAGRRNRERLEALADGAPQIDLGGRLVRFATGYEAEEMRRSARLLRQSGTWVRECRAADFAPSLPARFRFVTIHDDDRLLDTAALTDVLAQRARDQGVTVVAPAQVSRLEDDGEVRLMTSAGTLRAEIAIVATGVSLPQLVPFCRFKIVGMRAQWLRATGSAARGAEPEAWSAASGHETYRWHRDGSVTLCGSRRLPVQRELGVRDGTSNEVQALLEDNWREIEPARAVVFERGAAVQSPSCDGLPLAGPVPGHPRLLVSGGFGTNTPGLALAAGEAIAALVLTGRAAHAAAFSPRRFL